MLEHISQEQFEHILNLLIVYKQANRNKEVYLNERSIKEAIYFMNNAGKDLANKLGMN